MGSALANCLIKTGYEVNVWNRTPENADALVKAGAIACPSAEEAVSTGDLMIICIKSHRETVALVSSLENSLEGKTICDLSTGDTRDAERLVAMLEEFGADFMLGMINAYPSGIGADDTTILTVSSPQAWDNYGDIIRVLGGKSAYVGDQPSALAALFAGLFTVRQGFLFGMIYGALACQKAKIPVEVFSNQIPASLKLVNDYYGLFASTVPEEDHDKPEASMNVYAMAQEDALKTFQSLDAPAEFIQIVHERTKAACDDGYGEKQLTAPVAHMTGDPS